MQFTVLLSLVAGAQAAAYGYGAVPLNTTSAVESYSASSTAAYPVVPISSSVEATYPVSTPAGYPVSSKPIPSHYPVSNGTLPSTAAAPSGTGVPPSKTAGIPEFTGAASALKVSGLMGGVLAVAALL